MTHAYIRTMFNDQVRALIVFKRILHCNTRIFCSRKAKLFLATFYWCNAVLIILFRLLIIYTNTSHFLLPFVWLFVGIAFVHNFRQSTSHLCPFVIYPVNKYLSKCFESMCACFFCKLLLLWFHRANNVFSMLVLFATFFLCIAAAVLCFQWKSQLFRQLPRIYSVVQVFLAVLHHSFLFYLIFKGFFFHIHFHVYV